MIHFLNEAIEMKLGTMPREWLFWERMIIAYDYGWDGT
jgi:hypothetical protein